MAQAKKLDFIGYFQQSTVLQMITASSRVVCQRTAPGTRQTVELDNVPYFVHVHVRMDGLCGTVVADKDYPGRVAFTYLNKQLNDYETSQSSWKHIAIDQSNENQSLNNDIIKFQNPNEADKLTKIQSNLDEITQIMHKNIEEVLNRGESLDALMVCDILT